ncbi:hypothetical protein [Treponema zioleckii]|uniref:hypothetical protein n=1 Tax=Treponema zioleckii TaxID=331680 RepID=UPI00168B54F1|nr:hypothetical protein [Treponema zioleckii]
MKMLISTIFFLSCIINSILAESDNGGLMINSLKKLEATKKNAMDGNAVEAFRLFEHYGLALNDSSNGNLWLEICAENGSSYGMFAFSNSLKRNGEIERAKFWCFNAIKDSDFRFEKENFYAENPNFTIPIIENISALDFSALKVFALQGNIKAAEKLSEIDSSWLRIASQNGSKNCMKKYSELLEKKGDELSMIRSRYWLNKSKN